MFVFHTMYFNSFMRMLFSLCLCFSGADGGAEEEELKKLAEFLQFSPDAADYLLAEYSLNKLLTNTYDTIAKGVGVDFTEWER